MPPLGSWIRRGSELLTRHGQSFLTTGPRYALIHSFSTTCTYPARAVSAPSLLESSALALCCCTCTSPGHSCSGSRRSSIYDCFRSADLVHTCVCRVRVFIWKVPCSGSWKAEQGKRQTVVAMALSAVFARGSRQHVGVFCRSLSGDVTKEKLLALRGETGLGLDKCRAALVDKSGNVEEAAAFLKEEAKRHGWARMEKLGSRQSAQGLLGVIQTGDEAVSIVEVTCETDFVQRNDRFVELVHSAARAFHAHSRSLLPVGGAFGVGKYGFEQLRDLPLENGSAKLGDHLAEAVGVIGENIVIRQAVAITSPLLAAYAHSVAVPARDVCQFCHICSIADLQAVSADQAYGESQKQAARHVCQHLLSMDPSNPGLETTSRPYNLDNVREAHKATLAESFILDESKTVGEVLSESGLALGGFVRVQLGQEAK